MKFLQLAVCLLLFALPLDGANCTKTSVGLIPLTDGPGLYSSGLNLPPAAHLSRGQQIAAALRLRPLNVMLIIGMSNTKLEGNAFLAEEASATDLAPNLVIVNAAQDGATANQWTSTRGQTYVNADQLLAAAGVTPFDVGVLWIKLTNRQDGTFAQWRAKFATDLRTALSTLRIQYPNVQMVLFSSRIYGGYESGTHGVTINPEPYAYETGVVVKELIADHINNLLHPDIWIGWGPYLWADGTKPRSDGLIWLCSDFALDGLHPSAAGAQKVANQLSSFLRVNPVAKLWFLKTTSGTPGPTPRN